MRGNRLMGRLEGIFAALSPRPTPIFAFSAAAALRRAPRAPRPAFARLPAVWIAALLFVVGASRADVLTLASGGTVEGDIVARSDHEYTVRTLLGIVKVPVDLVKSVEPSTTPFREYDTLNKDCENTPAAHTKLAEWCDAHGLRGERAAHLKKAIELDTDYAPARKLLGHVKVGPVWVDGKAQRERAATAPADSDAVLAAREEEKAAAKAQLDWQRRILAVKSSLLDSGVERIVETGRKRILDIRDPMAILPLARVLNRGSVLCRKLLVEALSRFEQDESTLNLAVLALVDGNDDVRDAALAELGKRNDERVPAQFRKALSSPHDALIRRASVGLGRLKVTQAVPELIGVLTIEKRMRVDYPLPTYFNEFGRAFEGNRQVQYGDRSFDYRPQIGVVDPTGLVTIEWSTRVETVTVFRTEVREALRAMTGVDFGFDAAKWQDWYQENSQ